jgi:uncharacterized protein YecE (DUF72 family)
MSKVLIGTGGWAYFKIPKLRSLEAYSRAFNFVEVNSAFYETPSLKLAESWRKRVPPDFQFAVRCHRDLTHVCQLEPTREAFKSFDATIDLCNILQSKLLVLETPSSIKWNRSKIESLKDFFGGVDPKGAKIIWEIRQQGEKKLPQDLVNLMLDHKIVHCTDLSKESPAFESDVAYTRVFGKGQRNVYQFSDEELVEIDGRIARSKSSISVISFHNVRMYKDAARLKIYKETGKFPPVTNATGQQSLKAALMEDARFPATRQELIKDQGWKVIDLTENKRVHTSTLLEKLPERVFMDVDDVLVSLPPV